MSSLIEGLEWENTFALDADPPFAWETWVEELAEVLPLPIYSLREVFDVAAAFDMAQHARYFNNATPLQCQNVPPSLRRLLSAIGLKRTTQARYFVQALYSHCARYTVGLARVPAPSRLHMQNIPVVPYDLFQALNEELYYPKGLYLWLENAVAHRSERKFMVCVPIKQCSKTSGRRSRKYQKLELITAANDVTHRNIAHILEAMQQLSPQHAPVLLCSVSCAGTQNLSVVLEARQQ